MNLFLTFNYTLPQKLGIFSEYRSHDILVVAGAGCWLLVAGSCFKLSCCVESSECCAAVQGARALTSVTLEQNRTQSVHATCPGYSHYMCSISISVNVSESKAVHGCGVRHVCVMATTRYARSC